MYWIREMAEEIVEREELGGKTFKFKKDRNNYIKEIMQEIKIEEERIAFERDSVPCYECHQKVLPWKEIIQMTKDIYVCFSCIPKITENFIKKVEKLQKEEKQEWYTNNETFWWGGVDYCSVSMLYDVLAGKYTTKT